MSMQLVSPRWTHVVMMCMQSPRNPAAVRKYWISGDLKLSFALSTLVIVSLHGATPMRGVGVCDNGESLLFNTSSPSFSLSLFVQLGGSLKGASCVFLTIAAVSPVFSYALLICSISNTVHRLYCIWHIRAEHTWGDLSFICLKDGYCIAPFNEE